MSDDADRVVAIAAVTDRVQPDVAPVITTGEIELEVDRARLARTYVPGTAYNVHDTVLPPVRNGYSYRAVRPGTAGSLGFSEWATDMFATFTDGQSDPVLTWQNAGTDQFNPDIAGAESNIYDIGKAARALWLTRARRASSHVDDGDTAFSQIYEQATNMASSFEPFYWPTRIVRLDG